jgi:CheY-like chemotaxis protein
MKKQYILLIDDDPDEFDFFLNAMEKLPGLFDCTYAVSPDAAFSLLDEIKPDYIFVDMNMPLMSGLECIVKLKQTDAVSDVPAFIYTTGYDPILHKQAVHLGASGCVKKPSKPNDLVAMLQNLYTTGNL